MFIVFKLTIPKSSKLWDVARPNTASTPSTTSSNSSKKETVKQAIKNELIEIIEWTDNSKDTVVWQFPNKNKSIKNGAQLVVRESQMAILMYEGQFGDCFYAGTHRLETGNMPILTTLENWKYGFKNPFKTDIYYISTRQFTNIVWKTEKPFIVKDVEFGTIRLKASGKFALRVIDSHRFLTELHGTKSEMLIEEVVAQLKTAIATKFADTLAESKISVSDLAANYLELGERLLPLLKDDFEDYGLEITKFYLEHITLPPDVEARLDKKPQMNTVKNDMPANTPSQTAEVLSNVTTDTPVEVSTPTPQYNPPKQEVDVATFKATMALFEEYKTVIEAPYLQVTIPIMKTKIANEYVLATMNYYLELTKGLKKGYATGDFTTWSNEPVYKKAHNEFVQLSQCTAQMDYEESMKLTDFTQRINERYAEYTQKKATAFSQGLEKQQAEAAKRI